MEFTQIRPGIFSATLDPEQVNVSLIVGERNCLLVDTGSSPAQGAEIRQAIAQLTDRPLKTVVLSHGHWDHAFGLQAFAGLDSLGHENLADDWSCAENTAWASRQGLALASLPLPTNRMALIAVRDLGDVSVEIASFGPAHTHSDLITAVPSRRVLLVGDLVESGPPQFDETSSIDGWVQTLDSLSSMLREDTIVIPGHGTALDAAQVAHFRSGLAAIWDQSEWAFRQEVPPGEVYDFDNLEWPWDRVSVEQGIHLAYGELAARPDPGPTAPAYFPDALGLI